MTWIAARGNAVNVLIIGAGPAGAALALALKRAGVEDVLLADRPRGRAPRIGESAAPGIGPLLRRLGLDDRLEGRGHRPCQGNLSRWGRAEFEVDDFMICGQGPGWHLDRTAFDAWLRAEAVAAGARLQSPAQVAATRREGEGWRVEIRGDGGSFETGARWIVDATGRPAAVGRRLGAKLRRFDRLLALAARAEPAEGHGFAGFSLVDTCPLGWWYAARLGCRRGGGDADDRCRPRARGRAAIGCRLPTRLGREPGCGSLRPTRCRVRRGPGPVQRRRPVHRPRHRSGVAGAGGCARRLRSAVLGGPHRRSGGCPCRERGPCRAPGNLNAGREREVRAAYAARAEASLRGFLAEQSALYSRERRWTGSRFWQRRLPDLGLSRNS